MASPVKQKGKQGSSSGNKCSQENMTKAIIRSWSGEKGFNPTKDADKPTVDLIAQGLSVISGEGGFACGRVSYTGCCEGPWQINIRDAHTQISRGCSHDPNCSTNFAYKLWKGAGGRLDPWRDGFARDWVADTSIKPEYQEYVMGYLKASGGDIPGLLDTGPFGAARDVVDSVGEALGILVELIKTLFDPTFWLRVGKGLLGTIMLIFGLAALMRALLGFDLAGPVGAFSRRTYSGIEGVRGERAARGAGGAPSSADRARARRRLREGERVESRAGKRSTSGTTPGYSNPDDVPF